MLSKFKIVALLVFGLIVLLPGLTFFISGAPKPYGQKPFSTPPEIKSIFRSIALRDAGGDALVERLPLRKTALSFRNETLFKLNAVNSTRMFSGKEGWLFYKDQFRNYGCEKTGKIGVALNRLDSLSRVAELTGPNVLYSISPNKYSVYSDMAGPYGSKISDCYLRHMNLTESRVGSWPQTNVILHHNSVRQARVNNNLAFRPHDTHWTDIGGLYAFDEVLSWMGYQGPKLSESIKFQETDVSDSDLGNSMLLLKNGDINTRLEDTAIEKFVKTNVLPKGKILVLHDSFYQKISPHIDALFPSVNRLHYSRDLAKIDDFISGNDFIIVNVVERSFGVHFNYKTMDWTSPLSREILRENEKQAQTCNWDQSDNWLDRDGSEDVDYINLERSDSGQATPTSADPIMIFDIAQLKKNKGICIEFDFESPIDTKFEIFLQSRDWPTLGGLSIQKHIEKGPQKIKMIIPTDENTRFVRVDPVVSKAPFKLNSARLVSYD